MTNFKKDFPLLCNNNIVYLDNAATSQRPSSFIEAEKYFNENLNANPLRGLYSLGIKATDCYEASRERVRKFINAKKNSEIIFTRNATEAINLVAYSYGLNNLCRDDEILVAISEHHSNLLPWQMVSKATGAVLKFLYCNDDGSYSDEAVQNAVTPRTKLAAMAVVSNVTGQTNPTGLLTKLVHSNGGVVLLDAAQSVLHTKTDVTDADADFLVFSGHKMLAPMGIGVLYGKEALLNDMPPFLSGGEMIEYVTTEQATFAPLPHKFEAGTVNASGAYALSAAIDYIENIGFDNIERQERQLNKALYEGMSSIPHVHILGSDKYDEHNGILSFTIDDVHPHDIASILDSRDICIRAGHHCAQPLLKHLGIISCARASIAFYNDLDDIDRLTENVKNIRRLMGYGE